MQKVNSIRQQVKQFQKDGFVVIENALSESQLSAIKADLAKWVEESKQHTQPFGQIQDGRPRFDIEPNTHTSDKPALRRITSPAEISSACLGVVKDNHALDLVTQFFGPNIKHWGNKINLKLPSSGTEVRFHQDFPFEPHSNEDIVTVLFFLDDVTLENGPLEVVPGTHKGPLHSLWHNGVFTGAVSEDVELQYKSEAVSCFGKAGSACLMHSKLLHGSAANSSDLARCLYIVSYTAEDAITLVPNPLPSELDGIVVRGERTGKARCTNYDVELPEYPKEVSFFGQQDKAKNM
ncbi:MAG TPA: phytanoyl-CoA dioxygenase family protein [Candidatus Thioglobus sp.]|nr:phytanoyl-CoA dioxygenase family protein [Candidatus Thioglobus sp.]